MTGRAIKSALWTAMALFLFATFSQAAEASKVGFVDMNRALNESVSGKKALEGLKKIMDQKKIELQREKELIKQKKDDLDKQLMLLNDASKLEKQEEIRRLERDHNRRFSDTKEELAREESKATDRIRSELLQVIAELGRSTGYLLILEKQFSAILYAPDTIDLTDEVIKRYDEMQGE